MTVIEALLIERLKQLPRERGPVLPLQRQLKCISALPKLKHRAAMDVIEALRSKAAEAKGQR